MEELAEAHLSIQAHTDSHTPTLSREQLEVLNDRTKCTAPITSRPKNPIGLPCGVGAACAGIRCVIG